MKETYVVIPAFEPEPELCAYIDELLTVIRAKIIVVDDGSGGAYKEIFERIGTKENCTVLYHVRNRGKGAALKTGFIYVKNREGKECRVLCADCDGQHLAADGLRLLKKAEECPQALILGIRNFSKEDVPWKSRFGNRVSSVLLWFFSGIYLEDTQTGFRAFDGRHLELMTAVEGERFEYEMRVLIICRERGIPFVTERIETVYVNQNEGTHFRPVKDSIQVTAVLFDRPGKFLFSSAGCALMDLALFHIFERTRFFRLFLEEGFQQIAAATWTARVISASVNYMWNRKWVFRKTGAAAGMKESACRYLALCAAIAVLSAMSVFQLSELTGMEPAAAKILCDGCLFFLSYLVQKKWVFRNRRKDEKDR